MHVWPAIFIAVALLIHAARTATTTRSVVVMTFAVSCVLWLWIDVWIANVTAAGWPVLAAYMSVYPAIAVWCLRRIDRHPGLGRWPTAVTAPIIFIGLECIRGLVIFDGYAWYLIGQPLIEWPMLAQPAPSLADRLRENSERLRECGASRIFAHDVPPSVPPDGAPDGDEPGAPTPFSMRTSSSEVGWSGAATGAPVVPATPG